MDEKNLQFPNVRNLMKQLEKGNEEANIRKLSKDHTSGLPALGNRPETPIQESPMSSKGTLGNEKSKFIRRTSLDYYAKFSSDSASLDHRHRNAEPSGKRSKGEKPSRKISVPDMKLRDNEIKRSGKAAAKKQDVSPDSAKKLRPRRSLGDLAEVQNEPVEPEAKPRKRHDSQLADALGLATPRTERRKFQWPVPEKRGQSSPWLSNPAFHQRKHKSTDKTIADNVQEKEYRTERNAFKNEILSAQGTYQCVEQDDITVEATDVKRQVDVLVKKALDTEASASNIKPRKRDKVKSLKGIDLASHEDLERTGSRSNINESGFASSEKHTKKNNEVTSNRSVVEAEHVNTDCSKVVKSTKQESVPKHLDTWRHLLHQQSACNDLSGTSPVRKARSQIPKRKTIEMKIVKEKENAEQESAKDENENEDQASLLESHSSNAISSREQSPSVKSLIMVMEKGNNRTSSNDEIYPAAKENVSKSTDTTDAELVREVTPFKDGQTGLKISKGNSNSIETKSKQETKLSKQKQIPLKTSKEPSKEGENTCNKKDVETSGVTNVSSQHKNLINEGKASIQREKKYWENEEFLNRYWSIGSSKTASHSKGSSKKPQNRKFRETVLLISKEDTAKPENSLESKNLKANLEKETEKTLKNRALPTVQCNKFDEEVKSNSSENLGPAISIAERRRQYLASVQPQKVEKEPQPLSRSNSMRAGDSKKNKLLKKRQSMRLTSEERNTKMLERDIQKTGDTSSSNLESSKSRHSESTDEKKKIIGKAMATGYYKNELRESAEKSDQGKESGDISVKLEAASNLKVLSSKEEVEELRYQHIRHLKSQTSEEAAMELQSISERVTKTKKQQPVKGKYLNALADPESNHSAKEKEVSANTHLSEHVKIYSIKDDIERKFFQHIRELKSQGSPNLCGDNNSQSGENVDKRSSLTDVRPSSDETGSPLESPKKNKVTESIKLRIMDYTRSNSCPRLLQSLNNDSQKAIPQTLSFQNHKSVATDLQNNAQKDDENRTTDKQDSKETDEIQISQYEGEERKHDMVLREKDQSIREDVQDPCNAQSDSSVGNRMEKLRKKLKPLEIAVDTNNDIINRETNSNKSSSGKQGVNTELDDKTVTGNRQVVFMMKNSQVESLRKSPTKMSPRNSPKSEETVSISNPQSPMQIRKMKSKKSRQVSPTPLQKLTDKKEEGNNAENTERKMATSEKESHKGSPGPSLEVFSKSSEKETSTSSQRFKTKKLHSYLNASTEEPGQESPTRADNSQKTSTPKEVQTKNITAISSINLYYKDPNPLIEKSAEYCDKNSDRESLLAAELERVPLPLEDNTPGKASPVSLRASRERKPLSVAFSDPQSPMQTRKSKSNTSRQVSPTPLQTLTDRKEECNNAENTGRKMATSEKESHEGSPGSSLEVISKCSEKETSTSSQRSKTKKLHSYLNASTEEPGQESPTRADNSQKICSAGSMKINKKAAAEKSQKGVQNKNVTSTSSINIYSNDSNTLIEKCAQDCDKNSDQESSTAAELGRTPLSSEDQVTKNKPENEMQLLNNKCQPPVQSLRNTTLTQMAESPKKTNKSENASPVLSPESTTPAQKSGNASPISSLSSKKSAIDSDIFSPKLIERNPTPAQRSRSSSPVPARSSRPVPSTNSSSVPSTDSREPESQLGSLTPTPPIGSQTAMHQSEKMGTVSSKDRQKSKNHTRYPRNLPFTDNSTKVCQTENTSSARATSTPAPVERSKNIKTDDLEKANPTPRKRPLQEKLLEPGEKSPIPKQRTAQASPVPVPRPRNRVNLERTVSVPGTEHPVLRVKEESNTANRFSAPALGNQPIPPPRRMAKK